MLRDGRCTLYAQGGGAGYGFDYHFAIGPQAVLTWLDHLRTDPGDYLVDWWFDDVLSEGGVVIDVDRKVLLLFTAVFDYRHRAAILDGFSRSWAGWHVRWAYDGNAELAAYVGQDPQQIHKIADTPADEPFRGDYSDHLSAVVTVRGHDGSCRVYGLGPNDAWRAWWRGPQLVGWLADADMTADCARIPDAGLHLDLTTRQAGLWSIAPLRGLIGRWPRLWPQWTLEFWHDDYQRQAAASDWAVTFPSFDLQPHLDELASRVKEYWPARDVLLARGVEADWVFEMNIAGCRSQLKVGLTGKELDTAAALIRNQAL